MQRFFSWRVTSSVCERFPAARETGFILRFLKSPLVKSVFFQADQKCPDARRPEGGRGTPQMGIFNSRFNTFLPRIRGKRRLTFFRLGSWPFSHSPTAFEGITFVNPPCLAQSAFAATRALVPSEAQDSKERWFYLVYFPAQ